MIQDPRPAIKGVTRKPFIEVTDHEHAESVRWTKTLTFAALSGIAFYGVRWVSGNVKIAIDPAKLTYLSQGMDRPGQTPWHKVRGHQLVNGKIEAGLADFALEGLKRFEEIGGGIPRTFGLWGAVNRQAFTTGNTELRINAADLKGAESHYESLVNRKLSLNEKIHGFHVGPVEKAHLESFVTESAAAAGQQLNAGQVATQVDELIKSGKASPGKFPGLFTSTETGQRGSLIVPDVQVAGRHWNIPSKDIPLDPATGLPKHRLVVRDTQTISELTGATRPISNSSQSPYMVYKAPENFKFGDTSRDIIKNFVDPDKIEGFLSKHMTPGMHRASLETHAFAKRMSERYLKVLDNPLEAIEEFAGSHDTLTKMKQSKGYGYLKNLFGTGGNYHGTFTDLWGRHISRIAPMAIGLAGAYELGSMATKALTGNSIAQLGGQAVGAVQRLYAGVSDLTGLTSLNKYQEREAEGSHRLMGVLAFPMAGYLGGRVGASLTHGFVNSGETIWETARAEIHSLPDFLGPVKKAKLPVLGDLSQKMTRGKQFGIMGALAGAALIAPFLLGALGSNKSYDEVVAEQRGETEVEVRKGAGWEMGRTDIGGENIQYYRPGWYRRLMDDPTSDLQNPGYADRPFSRMVRGLVDPYWKEKKLYYERPYPITGPDTSGFGPLGTLWGMTVGRVLKPPVLMHAEEISEGGGSGAQDGKVIRFGRDVSRASDRALGGKGPTVATSPYSQSFLGGEMAYKATEASGLPGFILSSIKKSITGSDGFGDKEPVLASAASVGSMSDQFWDLNIGGGAMTTEGLRRFVPKERFQLDKVNPIRNEMPSWMPGPENYQDFQHGDPYAMIQEGEYRLPGSGYATRFNELKDLNYEDYPDIHKYKILGDVAPYSAQFKDVSKKMDSLAKSNQMSAPDRMLYESTKAEMEKKEKKVDFREKPTTLMGKYWGAITELGRKSPVEHLLPFSPIHKFAGPVSAIAEYEDRNIYSTKNPQWNNPIDDFIAPALRSVGNMLGFDGIPSAVQEKRELTGFFDKLEYVKYKDLEANARAQGAGQVASSFARKADFTMFGADPYGDIDTVRKILPREERPFFEEFLAADTADERGRILSIVPEYTKKFYTAQWQKQLYTSIAAKGDVTSSERLTASAIEAARATEGQDTDVGTWNQYQRDVNSGDVAPNTFPDFIRAKRLQTYFDKDSPFEAPGADWIGYHPGVDMDRVKLKVVEAKGKDFHDYDLWDGDVAQAAKEPYLDEAADHLMSNGSTRTDLMRSLTSMKIRDLNVDVTETAGDRTRIILDLKSDRKAEIDRELRKRGIGREGR